LILMDEPAGVGLSLETPPSCFRRTGRTEDPAGSPAGSLGQGASICLMCADACFVYHDARARGLDAPGPRQHVTGASFRGRAWSSESDFSTSHNRRPTNP
jgi:hypothetical protein